jgi:dUTP pyrophosphatase
MSLAMRISVLDEELYHDELQNGFRPKLKGDAGIDMRARETTTVQKDRTAVIPLGISIQIPEMCVGWLTGRSSTVTAFNLVSHEGKIDSGYRGEIHAMVTALERSVQIQRGERIAQLVVVRIAPPTEWHITSELGSTERGAHGLGSTGRI